MSWKENFQVALLILNYDFNQSIGISFRQWCYQSFTFKRLKIFVTVPGILSQRLESVLDLFHQKPIQFIRENYDFSKKKKK